MTRCVPVVLIGAYMDPHCWIHNSFRRHVCQDLEGARHLQKCQDEEEGNEKSVIKYVFYNDMRGVKKVEIPFTDTFTCSNYEKSAVSMPP